MADDTEKHKACTGCRESKPLGQFNRMARSPDGHAWRCRDCARRFNAKSQKAYRAANPERCRLADRRWRQANPGVAWITLYFSRMKHSDRRVARTAARKAKMLRAMPDWLSKEDRQKINAFYTVARWLSVESGVKHEVDHIVPLINPLVCGLHVPWNLQILTREENRSKGNRF